MLHDKRFFNILEDVFDGLLLENFSNNKFFNEFVDFKNMDIGESDYFDVDPKWTPLELCYEKSNIKRITKYV